MFAVYATSASPSDPLSALEIGERPAPEPPDGWARVRIRAASLNHHDLWSLRGVGLDAANLPMILGCDGTGVDDEDRATRRVVVRPSYGHVAELPLEPSRIRPT